MRSLIRVVFCCIVVITSVGAQNPCPPGKPPLTPDQARENLRKAHEAHEAAKERSYEAVRKFVDYRAIKSAPGRWEAEGKTPPQWDQSEFERLAAEAYKRHGESVRALNEWREAQNALKKVLDELEDLERAARRRPGQSGLPSPNRSPRPGAGLGTKTEPDLGDTLPGHPPSSPGGMSGAGVGTKTQPDLGDTLPGHTPPSSPGGTSGAGVGTKTQPDLGDTLPGHPPVPPSKMAAGAAGTSKSFWAFTWPYY
jgi:hypothetical protein